MPIEFIETMISAGLFALKSRGLSAHLEALVLYTVV